MHFPTLKRSPTASSQSSSAPLRPKSFALPFEGLADHSHPPPSSPRDEDVSPVHNLPHVRRRKNETRLGAFFSRLRSIFTTSRVVHTLYAILALLILASGSVLAVFSLLWMYPSPTSTPSLVSLVVNTLDLYAALITGVLLSCTALLSVPCLISTSTNGLYFLNITLYTDILISLGGAAIIWWRTLRPRASFGALWSSTYTNEAKALIQDRFDCCGYWTSSLEVLSASCPSEEIAQTKGACVDAYGDYAAGWLNGVSTFVWGVVGMLCFWIIVNACIVSFRDLKRRFVLIDKKNNGEKAGLFV